MKISKQLNRLNKAMLSLENLRESYLTFTTVGSNLDKINILIDETIYKIKMDNPDEAKTMKISKQLRSLINASDLIDLVRGDYGDESNMDDRLYKISQLIDSTIDKIRKDNPDENQSNQDQH